MPPPRIDTSVSRASPAAAAAASSNSATPQDGFEKVLAQSNSVEDACERLSSLLLRAQETPQLLYAWMLPLCATVFGKNGWLRSPLRSEDRDAVYRFLEPTGPLLRCALKLSNEAWVFDVVTDKLPRPSQRLLDPRYVSALPKCYEGRWELPMNTPILSADEFWGFSARHSPYHSMDISSPLRSTAAGQFSSRIEPEPKVKIRLHLFEYYMFSFALFMVDTKPEGAYGSTRWSPNSGLANSNPNERNSRKNPSKMLSGRFGSSTASSKLPHHKDSSLHFDLQQSYLNYFLPFSKPMSESKKAEGSSHSDQEERSVRTQSPQRGFRRDERQPFAGVAEDAFGRPKMSNPTLFTDTPLNLDPATLARIADFFSGIVAEEWLNQNDYAPDTGYRISPSLVYLQPPVELLQSVLQFIEHLSKSDMRERVQGVLNRSDMSRYLDKNVQQMALSDAYRTFSPGLYRFLRIALNMWPMEEAFGKVINLWLVYITPWKFTPRNEEGPDRITEDWIPFIQQNLFFYSVLLPVFLERAVIYKYFTSAEAAVVSGDASRRQEVIDLLTRRNGPGPLTHGAALLIDVLTVFQTEGLAQVLKDAENAYLQAASQHAYQSSTPFSPPSKPRQRSPNRGLDGKMLFECMERLEGNGFQLPPYFTAPYNDKISAINIMGSISQAYDIKAALRRKLQTSAKPLTFQRLIDLLNGNSVIHALEKLDTQEKSLLQMSGMLESVLELPSQDLHDYDHANRGTASHVHGALAMPETEPGDTNHLTARGRAQIKQGLRRFTYQSAMDVKAHGPRAATYVKSYENKYLVAGLTHSSGWINHKVHDFADHHVHQHSPFIANYLRAHSIDFRFLASYRTITLIISLLVAHQLWIALASLNNKTSDVYGMREEDYEFPA